MGLCSTLWGDSNNKEKESSTFKEYVEDTGNNLDVDYGRIDGHVDARTWSDVDRRGTIGVRNVQT